jgi:hypothetical protein
MRASIRSRSACRRALSAAAVHRWRRRHAAAQTAGRVQAEDVGPAGQLAVDLARRQRRPDDRLRAVLRETTGEAGPGVRRRAPARRRQRGQRAGVGEDQDARRRRRQRHGVGQRGRPRPCRTKRGLFGPALAQFARAAVDQPDAEAAGATLAQQVGDDRPEVVLVGLQALAQSQTTTSSPPQPDRQRRGSRRSGRAPRQLALQARQVETGVVCLQRRAPERRPQARLANQRNERRRVAVAAPRRAVRRSQRRHAVARAVLAWNVFEAAAGGDGEQGRAQRRSCCCFDRCCWRRTDDGTKLAYRRNDARDACNHRLLLEAEQAGVAASRRRVVACAIVRARSRSARASSGERFIIPPPGRR